ncbi:MAG: hypothetical protein AAFO07_03495, partial [Bacteroidota bacterium]
GTFTLQSEKITHAGLYTLKIKDNYSNIALFEGDNINLDIDLSEPSNSFFATGIGAGKLNVMKLPQLAYPTYEGGPSLEHLLQHLTDTITAQKNLLDAIYSRDLSHPLILSASNKSYLQRIIKETPLSDAEYEFLRTYIWAHSTFVTGMLSKVEIHQGLDSFKIDPNHKLFAGFNKETYQAI